MMGFSWTGEFDPEPNYRPPSLHAPRRGWRWPHRTRQVRVDADALTHHAATLAAVASALAEQPVYADVLGAVAADLRDWSR